MQKLQERFSKKKADDGSGKMLQRRSKSRLKTVWKGSWYSDAICSG